MKIVSMSVGLLIGLLAVGCNQFDSQRESVGDAGSPSPKSAVANDDEDDGDERDIPLAEVPAVVSQAALSAVPGLVLTSAEIEEENGTSIYSLEGTAAGEAWCVEVSPTGQVLEIEQEDDEDDDDDDDEDED
jgi:hypothetical protein